MEDTLNPSIGVGRYAALPLETRALIYGGMVLLIIAPALCLISDRRPFVRIVPQLAELSVRRERTVCLVVILIGFILVGLLSQPVAS